MEGTPNKGGSRMNKRDGGRKYVFGLENNRLSRWSQKEWQENIWKVLVLLLPFYEHPHPDCLQTSKTPVKPNTLFTLQT